MMQVFASMFARLCADVFSGSDRFANTLASTAANTFSLAKHLPLALRVCPPKSPARFPTPLTQRLKNNQCEWGLESLGDGGISGVPEGGGGGVQKEKREEEKGGERREAAVKLEKREKEEEGKKEKEKKKKEKPTRRAVMGWGGGDGLVVGDVDEGVVSRWMRAGRIAAISCGGRR